MLKRYLRTNFDMTPEQYRAKWNQLADYPMVAPNYAATRRDLAVKIGLGRKRGSTAAAKDDAAASADIPPNVTARKRLGIASGDQTPATAPEMIER